MPLLHKEIVLAFFFANDLSIYAAIFDSKIVLAIKKPLKLQHIFKGFFIKDYLVILL